MGSLGAGVTLPRGSGAAPVLYELVEACMKLSTRNITDVRIESGVGAVIQVFDFENVRSYS